MRQPETTLSRWSKLLPRLARYMPASLFNSLRALPENLEQIDQAAHPALTRDLLQITRTLEPLHRVLVQYMPRYLNELDPTPGQPHGEILEGSFIFADVTGFTALTELLARQGQARGRELMNQIMNRLFSEILDPLIASGGDLLIFAGDAALVYFPKQENDEDILQATRAALRMERAINPFASFETEYGQCSLTMSAGLERGLAYAGVVGRPNRMELLVSGPGIDGAMQAEVQAEPGQVMLGKQAQAVARNHFTMQGAWVVDDLGDALGDYEISPPTRKRGGAIFMGMDIPEILTTIETALQRVERLAPFLPEDMLAHLVNTERHRKLVSEFRPVAVQFIHIVGLEALAIEQGPERATAIFQRYFVRAQEIVNQHEGVISQVDAYAQGFFLLNTFGAPKAHEGTTRYAVSAALQLAKALEQVNRKFGLEKPLQQRGGITYGLVFNGEVGARYRRESVVAGPAVNRAARLMSKAQFGQVILDSGIWNDIRGAFVGQELPAVSLKGIAGQVVIVNVQEIRRGTRLQPLERPLLGREMEQAQLARAREELLYRDQGGIRLIYGETGIGKTALILDLAEKARKQDLMILAGRCQPHGKNIPLFVWIDLLTGWLDVDESADPAKARARLSGQLESLDMADAELALTNLLNLSGQAPQQTQDQSASTNQPLIQNPKIGGTLLGALSQKVEREATLSVATASPGGLTALLGHRLAQSPHPHANKTLWKRLEDRITTPHIIIKLLEQLSRKQPLLMILEDIHWLDPESRRVLKQLLPQVARLPLLLVLTSRQLSESQYPILMKLNPLSSSAVTQIAQRALGAQTLDSSLAEWICRQAHGNPLYAEELCKALYHTDSIFLDRETGDVRWTKQAPDLPLSLHELMLARLDELPLAQQNVLKWAAVIGMSCAYEGLLRLSQTRMSEREFGTALEQVVQAGFLVEEQKRSYRFNHPLMQEAIYATLSFAQKQAWHTEIGNWLAEQPADQALELIAYHYLLGNDEQKAASFGLKAGDRAREQGAYAGALEYYGQVLALQNVSIRDRMLAAEYQGDVLTIQRDYGAAQRAYDQAAQLGSHSALEKQAIIAGDLERLSQVEFSPELYLWGEGSRAWLLAQSHQLEPASTLVQTIIQSADGRFQEDIQRLAQALTKGESPGPYEFWLHRFTQEVLL